MAHGEGGGGEDDFSLGWNEDEREAGGQQAARMIERAIAKGFESLELERKHLRQEEAGTRQTGALGGSTSGIRMGVMPPRGALNRVPVAGQG